jgi:histidine triad (HIT) family protein
VRARRAGPRPPGDRPARREGVNLIQSNRTAGWQQVFHFHLHVVPRYRGDALRAPWAPSSLDDATASELTALLA